MGEVIKLDNREYEVYDFNDKAKAVVTSLKFVNTRLQELNNMQALLQRAKNSYVDSIKKEMISEKSGLLFGDD